MCALSSATSDLVAMSAASGTTSAIIRAAPSLRSFLSASYNSKFVTAIPILPPRALVGKGETDRSRRLRQVEDPVLHRTRIFDVLLRAASVDVAEQAEDAVTQQLLQTRIELRHDRARH